MTASKLNNQESVWSDKSNEKNRHVRPECYVWKYYNLPKSSGMNRLLKTVFKRGCILFRTDRCRAERIVLCEV